jgi:nicotinamidase/pyrazinamidase
VIAEQEVLLVVDVQNDFCPGGALAVAQGNAVVAPINNLIADFTHLVLTQDWHPPGHRSFASAHPGRKPFERIEMPYGPQTLWPDHCVQDTPGAAFHAGLHIAKAELILRKGFRRDVDSYSVFFENDKRTATGLGGYLQERRLRHVHLAGLATDYCVAWSALDARNLGFDVTVHLAACRAIDHEGSYASALARMREAGVQLTEAVTVDS